MKRMLLGLLGGGLLTLAGTGAVTHTPAPRAVAYHPHVTGLISVGDGTLTASWSQSGDVVTVEFNFLAGPTTIYQRGADFAVSLPVPAEGFPVFTAYVHDNHWTLPAEAVGGNLFVSTTGYIAALTFLATSEMGPDSVVLFSGSYLAAS